MPSKSLTRIHNRVELWETRAQQAAARGELKRAGRLQTKVLELREEARRIEEKHKRNPI